MPTTLPNLGLVGRWTDGEDGWGDDLNDAIDVLSIWVQPRVLSRVSTLPGSPTNGDLHIFTGTGPEQNQLVARISGSWEYFSPQEGYRVYDLNTSEYLSFVGGSWVSDPTTLVSDFLDLADVSGDYDGRAGFSVVVNSTEDGLEFVNLGAGVVDFLDLTDTPGSYSGQGGKLVAVNSGATALEFVDAPSGGAEDFLDLTDTPGSYSGQGGKLVAVNSGATALEFVNPPMPLPTTASNASKILRVNAAADGVEWAEDITTSSVGASRDLTNTDFSGGKTLLVSSGSAVALNLPTGLTRTSPVLIVRQGTGAVTVTSSGGVTLNSADGNVALRVRYSSASIIPVGTNSYILVGDLA
jgi:hypothetical protein